MTQGLVVTNERTQLYTTRGQREQALTNAKQAGETVVHDDFAVGPNGENQLTFGIVDIDPPTAEEIELRGLVPKLSAGTATSVEVQRYLVLKDNL